MIQQPVQRLAIVLGALLVGACAPSSDVSDGGSSGRGFPVKMLLGSALGEFCDQAATQFNQTQPKLSNGEAFHLACEAQGSGDVVNTLVTQAAQFQSGALPAEAPEFPTLVSVDGEIYHSQLIYQIEQLFPGQNYIPAITDAPLLASSPMVFMTSEDLAPGLQKTDDLFKALVTATTHRDLDAASSPQTINYVHTAPTRSNSGLQTLVSQFASVSGKAPQDLSAADVTANQAQIQKIQQKITRYGVSTSSLSEAMVQNGLFWASIGSVYESSVIAANSNQQANQSKYVAVYPKATFTSSMRGILPTAPWVSAEEKEAATQVLEYLQSTEAQKLATNLGLRPGTPGVPLGPKFTAQYGVNPQAKYDSLRPPQPQVVEAMLKVWATEAKKSSLVVVVIDSSGSMSGNKLPAVQSTLQTYLKSLGPKDRIALIDFDSQIQAPVLVDGTPEGRDRGIEFISGLQADGGTRLYDATLTARDWLQQNLRPDAINAILVLTDGADSGSSTSLSQLEQELGKSGFASDQRIALFTIGYGREGEFNADILEKIASLNGGYYKKGDPATIQRLMADLQLEF
ncbi:extracellular solute-binding protein [Acaryochloris thomasi]|nr:extracellular solute-binding protein [Acaryochloris thomasi]